MHYRIIVLSKFHNYISLFAYGVAEGAILNHSISINVEVDGRKDRDSYKYYIGELRGIFGKIRPHIVFCNGLLGETEVVYPGILEFLYEMRKSLGVKVCYHMGDPRTNPRYPTNVSEAFDIVLMNIGDESVLQHFTDVWKVPTYYWPYGCWQREYMSPPEKPFIHDMVYTGNMSTHDRYKDRTRFINQCLKSSVFKLEIFPNENYNNTRYYHHVIAASCKGMIGVCAIYDLNLYIDARPFECLGGGGLLFRPVSKGIDKVFVDKEHLVLFGSLDNPYDMKDLEAKYWYYVLDHPEEGTKIKRQGFEFVQKYHNYKNRVEDVINILSGRIKRARVFLEDFNL